MQKESFLFDIKVSINKKEEPEGSAIKELLSLDFIDRSVFFNSGQLESARLDFLHCAVTGAVLDDLLFSLLTNIDAAHYPDIFAYGIAGFHSNHSFQSSSSRLSSLRPY